MDGYLDYVTSVPQPLRFLVSTGGFRPIADGAYLGAWDPANRQFTPEALAYIQAKAPQWASFAQRGDPMAQSALTALAGLPVVAADGTVQQLSSSVATAPRGHLSGPLPWLALGLAAFFLLRRS